MADNSQLSYWKVLEPIWEHQESTDSPIRFFTWFNGLSEAQKILFPTHWLCCEVYNGGFHQYFTNSTGIHAPEAMLGFQKLGLSDIAKIVEEAMAIFGELFPREQTERIRILKAFPGERREERNPFFTLDERFYDAIEIPGVRDADRFTVVADKFVNTIVI